jgi:hypothetical protein
VAGALTRVHSVSPAVVAQTIARRSSPGILTRSDQATLDTFAKVAVMNATQSASAALRDVELSWCGHGRIEAHITRDSTRATRVRVRHGEVGGYTIAVTLWR